MTYKHIESVIGPWKLTNISHRPFDGFYSFNPSIHRDVDGTIRCLMRNADYHAPSGVYIANKAKGGRVTTRNALAILEPGTWKIEHVSEITERDGNPRYPASSLGFEDMRLFRTAKDGLLGVATTMHLHPEAKQEIVIVRFDPVDFAIVAAEPVRGAWSAGPQKNWVPFDGAETMKLLYSIDSGWIFGRRDDLGTQGSACPIGPLFALPGEKIVAGQADARLPEIRFNGSIETRIPPTANKQRRVTFDWSIAKGLRGGSQLVPLGDGRWLGIGHEMRWNGRYKLYWHTWFTVDNMGALVEKSDPMKLSHCGIEFAAGLVVDAALDHLIVSFGTEDQDSWIAECALTKILATLRPVEKIPALGGVA